MVQIFNYIYVRYRKADPVKHFYYYSTTLYHTYLYNPVLLYILLYILLLYIIPVRAPRTFSYLHLH